MPGGVKKCTICKENKRFSDFGREENSRKYLGNCKTCTAEAISITLRDTAPEEKRHNAEFEIERLRRQKQYQNSIIKQMKESVEA